MNCPVYAMVPNLKNLKPIFTNTADDPGNKWSVPWQWGTAGLMYRKDRIREDQATSWSVVFDPKKAVGPFWLIDSVREMMGITLLYPGHDFNSTDPNELKAAADFLVATKKTSACLGFKPGVGGKNDVVAGTAACAIVYNGDAIQSEAGNPDILAFTIPDEGSLSRSLALRGNASRTLRVQGLQPCADVWTGNQLWNFFLRLYFNRSWRNAERPTGIPTQSVGTSRGITKKTASS